jgi:hypothetical protein
MAMNSRILRSRAKRRWVPAVESFETRAVPSTVFHHPWFAIDPTPAQWLALHGPAGERAAFLLRAAQERAAMAAGLSHPAFGRGIFPAGVVRPGFARPALRAPLANAATTTGPTPGSSFGHPNFNYGTFDGGMGILYGSLSSPHTSLAMPAPSATTTTGATNGSQFGQNGQYNYGTFDGGYGIVW